uniref:TLC domain-containing protein 4-B-like isoform X3 n=1 Tax=Styela clava TaxID=7725 RepID=UPI001939778C|nr:TLC domain-containing protein 4-B-like isoform X3 [Styela clava]
MNSTSTGTVLYVTSIICVSLFYEILRIKVAPALFNSYTRIYYERLSSAKKLTWGMRCISKFASISNSIIVVSLTVISLNNPGVWGNPFQAHPWSVQASVSITAGYFVADMTWMLRYPVEAGAHYSYKFHHLFSLLGFYTVLSYPMLGHLVSIRLLSELSQPYTHFRDFYKEINIKLPPLYVLNSICFTMTFTFTRIFSQLLFYTKLWEVFGDNEFYRVPMHIHVMWLSAGAFLDILNMYWYTLVVRGMWKILMEYHNKTS